MTEPIAGARAHTDPRRDASLADERQQSQIDESLEETFPASDPPAHRDRSRPPSARAQGVHVVRLIERFEVAYETMAFRFEKPPGFHAEAGQHVRITLRGEAGREPLTPESSRRFSLASAPSEPFLMIATRMRGSVFKDRLATCPIGSEADLEDPFGDLMLHDDATVPAVLLARGIGITPFRSMLVEAAARQLPHRFFLFYSNRRATDAPFLAELQKLDSERPNFTLVLTMTQPSEAWRGETAHLDRELIARYLRNVSPPVYYLAGPGRMVHQLVATLTQQGIRAERIRTEVFEGY